MGGSDIDDASSDEYNRAIEVGKEIDALLRLAAGWCKNIGATKGPLGTGMLEEMTEVPI